MYSHKWTFIPGEQTFSSGGMGESGESASRRNDPIPRDKVALLAKWNADKTSKDSSLQATFTLHTKRGFLSKLCWKA